MRTWRRGNLALLGAALATTGCSWFLDQPEPKAVSAFRAPAAEFAVVRRVMVLPFAFAPGVEGDRDSARQIRDAFLAEFAKLQRFEIVPLPEGADEHLAINDGAPRGALPARALLALGKRYRLDGLILGTITAYRPYLPPHLGVRVQLTSVHSGATVWAAEGLYDSSERATERDVRHYALSYLAKEDSDHGWRMNVIAPRRFAAFVAHRLVATCRAAE